LWAHVVGADARPAGLLLQVSGATDIAEHVLGQPNEN
jgi:hypothetical protein